MSFIEEIMLYSVFAVVILSPLIKFIECLPELFQEIIDDIRTKKMLNKARNERNKNRVNQDHVNQSK